MRQQYYYLFLVFAVGAINGIGQIVMRWGGRFAETSRRDPGLLNWFFTSRWWLCGIVLCWFCGLAWAVLLRKVDLLVALPIFIGITCVASAIGGVSVLAERLSYQQWAGFLLVLVGVLLLSAHR